MKFEGVRRRVAVRRLGRIASLMEVRIVQMADEVKGGVIISSDSLVVCARRVAAQVERRGTGEGLSLGGVVPSGGRELREAMNWSRSLPVVERTRLSFESPIAAAFVGPGCFSI